MSFEEKYLDVLQNLEFAIIEVYRTHEELLDYDALSAVEAVIDFCKAKQIGREMRDFKLSANSQLAFEGLKQICEFRLDKENMSSPISENELIDCLKRIKKSIERWTKQNGRKGYLNFVQQYLP